MTVSGTEPSTTTRIDSPGWSGATYTATSSTWTVTAITGNKIGSVIGLTNSATMGAGPIYAEFRVLYGFWKTGSSVWTWLSESASEGSATGTTCKLIFNGSTIEYYIDDVLKYTESSPAVTTGLFCAALSHDTDTITTATATGATVSSGGTRLPPPPLIARF